MIITSADEAGRSFFLLGYDQRYIVEAIEQHFTALAKAAHEPGQRFGLQYLKKMITLSVSVPRPSAQQVQELLMRIDSEHEPVAAEQQQERTAIQRLRLGLTKSARHTWRAITDRNVARQVGLAAALVAITLFSIALFGGADNPPTTVTRPPASAAIPLPAIPPTADGITTIDMPSVDLPADPFAQQLWWLIPALLLLSAGGALYVANRPATTESAYRREPKDSTKFVSAVELCKALLPKNPRDAIRIINLMRMEYLVQESKEAPLDGSPLDEWECVSFTILEKRHPAIFQKVLTELDGREITRGAATGNGARPHNIDISGATDLASDLDALKDAGASTAHLANASKLRRFVDLNRFLLETGG